MSYLKTDLLYYDLLLVEKKFSFFINNSHI